MTQGKDRIQRVAWTDILMAQKNSDDFIYEGAKIAVASSGSEYNIEPGEPVYLVSTDSNGVKTVAPIDNTESTQVAAFCGFVIHRHTIQPGETDDTVVIATGGVRLDRSMLPTTDQFGNAISWDYADGSIRKVAEGKDFYFGQSAR